MGFILFIHIVVAILLVISILMQAGRGGGLAESFSSAESMFGTQTNKFMVRLSTILATIFFCTSLILAVNSAKGNKSLMANAKLPVKTEQTMPAQEPAVKVSEPQPVTQTKEAPTAPVSTNTAQ
jgi:preprotein translocase subunit SecG